MRKIKYLLFVMLCCLFTNVKAVDDCTTEEMNRLRELANKVEFKTNYEIKENEADKQAGYSDYIDVIYTIDVINYNDDLKIYYIDLDNKKNELEIKNLNNIYFYENNKIQFQIYSYTDNLCTDELLRTITIDFPVYSRYYHYNKEKCQNNQEFKYCKEFYDNGNKTTKEIEKLFEEFLNKDKNNNKLINSTVNYNIYIMIATVLILSALLIYFIIKKIKKDNDLK